MLELTILNYNKYYNKDCVSWIGIWGLSTSVKMPIKYKMVRVPRVMSVKYCTPQEVLNLIEKRKKVAKNIMNYKQFINKWDATIKRSKELLNERV